MKSFFKSEEQSHRKLNENGTGTSLHLWATIDVFLKTEDLKVIDRLGSIIPELDNSTHGYNSKGIKL